MAQPISTIRFDAIIKPILTASLLVIPVAATNAPSKAIATDISQGCAALGGTYHSLEDSSWMCLYSTPNHNESLGIYCNLNQQCDRLVYSRRTDGRLALEWQPITPPERTDD
jgi:hypothetical protein